jgi:chemotaxis protein methyltransferase CheR
MEPFDHDQLDRFRSIVGARLGLQFDDGRMDVMAEVLRQRLDADGRMGCERYLAALAAGGREEFRQLASLLTVSETYFFRVPEHFRVFAEFAVPERLRTLRSDRPLRILSAGCASGDEPYSAAIALRERFPQLSNVVILGIDLNPAMLAKAAEGRYGPWSLREMAPDLRERYFRREGRHFILDSCVRRMVTFEERNLGVANGTPWNLELFDIVFCRNTIMYMVPEAARLTVARLTQSLDEGGLLFLSHAETLRGLSQDFHLCHTHDTFYYRRREGGLRQLAPQEPPLARFPNTEVDLSWVDSVRLASEQIQNLSRNTGEGTAPPLKSVAPPGHQRAPLRLGLALDLLRQERFREALEAVGNLPAEFAKDPDVLLLRAVLLTNCGDSAAGEAVCRQLLAADDLNASAQYLAALCREHAGDFEGAIERDRAAIYLDPAFAMPHLHLGLLAKRSHDWTTVRKEMDQALRLLEREDASRILLLGGGFSRQALLEFSRAELQACGAKS